MSTGWILLLSSLAGALFGAAINRRDPLTVGLGISCGVACGFVAIYGELWPLVPGALLGVSVLLRRP